MSGFLNNLVTKSLAPAAIIRPRLLSLFEPVPGSDARVPPEAVESHAREPMAADVASTTDRPNDAPQQITHAAARAASAEQEQPPQPSGTLDVVPAPPVTTAHVAVVAPAPPETRQSNKPPVAAALMSIEPTAPLLIERTTDRVTVERLVVPEQTSPSPTASSRDVVPQPPPPRLTPDEHAAARLDSRSPHRAAAGDTTLLVMRERSTDDAPAAVVLRPPERIVERTLVTERPGAVLFQPQIRPSSEPARARGLTDTPAATPTIHVTIGRIEVRATQQPGPTTRARQEPARLSLDDYLRQRSRGGGG